MDNVAEQIIHEVMQEAEAAAVTGGASAGSGEYVVTGDSSASVQVTNVVNSSSSGGSSHTIIEKTVDGVTTTHEEIKDFAPGEPVEVNVSVQAVSGGQAEPGGSSSDSSSDEASASTTAEVGSSTDAAVDVSIMQSFSSYIVDTVTSLVDGFFNLFK